MAGSGRHGGNSGVADAMVGAASEEAGPRVMLVE
jgi:hypothetical protein